MKTKLESFLRRFSDAADLLRSPFLLLVRLYWGWQFMIAAGWDKVIHTDKAIRTFTRLGIPFPPVSVHFIAGLELAGGLLLVLGLAARPVSLILTVEMLVAYATAKRDALFSFISDPNTFTAAPPFPFLMASLIVLSCGAGALSIDHWIAGRAAARRLTWKRPDVPAGTSESAALPPGSGL